MRSVLQIVLVLGVIVASIFGITFVNQYKVTKEDEGKGGVGPNKGPEMNLIFPVKKVEWDPESAGEREGHREGYLDFWFESRKNLPVELGLYFKNCKCTKLEVCVLPKETAKQYRHRLLAEVALPILRSSGGLLDWIGQTAIEFHLTRSSPVGKLQWQALEENHPVTVPPLQAGLLRMNWDGKSESAERLTVEIWSQQQGEGTQFRQMERLELPVKFVSAIRVHQPTPRMDDLYPEKQAETTFVCWSSTRAAFSLTAQEKRNDPCFTCSWTPLDDKQCALLAETVKARVWCGYEVKVQVHERLPNKAQLDLGPFLRQIALTSDVTAEPTIAYLGGVVRGEVAIGTPEDKDRIDLRTFRSDRGTNKTITVWTERPGLELDCDNLTVEPGELGYLKSHIQLKKKEGTGGQSRWELSVKIPPDRVSGKLPDHSAIFIKIQGTQRQIRVPIIGNAYRL